MSYIALIVDNALFYMKTKKLKKVLDFERTWWYSIIAVADDGQLKNELREAKKF